VRDSDRGPGASEDRGVGLVEAGGGLGLDAVVDLDAEALGIDGSCLAFDAAVGAVRRVGRLIGFVPSLGLSLDDSDGCESRLSKTVAFATDEAVGAVRELRLDLVCVDVLGDSAFEAMAEVDEGVLWLAGDFRTFGVGFEDALVARGDGLPLGVALEAAFLAVLDAVSNIFFAGGVCASTMSGSTRADSTEGSDGLRSSATGGNASPPLTAFTLVRSAGCISLGSSSAPVVGLSGFTGSWSSTRARRLSSTVAWALLFSAWVFGVAGRLSAAFSGMASATFGSLSRLSASLETVFFSSSNPSSPSFSPKLPLLSPALLCLFRSAKGADESNEAAIPPDGSTDTKLARTFDVGLLFSVSGNPPLDRPRVSGELLSDGLVSKIDLRLWTAEEARSEDMAGKWDGSALTCLGWLLPDRYAAAAGASCIRGGRDERTVVYRDTSREILSRQ